MGNKETIDAETFKKWELWKEQGMFNGQFEQTEAFKRTFFGQQEQLYKVCREFKQEILKSAFLQRSVEGLGKFFDCILKKL